MSALSIDAVNDAIPLREAARLAGQKRETVRAWVRRGHLEDYRDQDGKRHVSRQALVDYCRKRGLVDTGGQPQGAPTAAPNGRPADTSTPLSRGSDALVEALNAHIGDLREERTRLLHERDEALRRVEALEERLAAVEGARRQLEGRANAVDTELADIEERLQKAARKGWSAEKLRRKLTARGLFDDED